MKNSNKLPLQMQEEIAKRLKTLRTTAGYTQKEIAEKMRITEKTYRSWEVGVYDGKTNTKYYPAIEYNNLFMLADIYNVSIDYLLHRSDCTSVDNDYISRKTGLSDRSINVLCDSKNRKDIIDAFISSPEYMEYDENSLYFLKLKFENFQKDVKKYTEIYKVYENTDKQDYNEKERLAKLADRMDLYFEINLQYIESFGYRETFIFEKFLDEYKKKLAVKCEYDKYKKQLQNLLNYSSE